MTCVRERQQILRTGSRLVAVLGLLVFLLGLPAWSSGDYHYSPLSLPDGWGGTDGLSINDSKTVVGTVPVSGTGPMSEGFISSMTTTGRDVTMLLPGWADKFAGALGINNAGVVVGYGTSGSETQGFVYTPGSPSGTINALPQPPFLTDFQAQGINSAGTIVGYGPTPSGPWAGSYSSVGGYTQISPPGLSNAQALAINLSGAIVGQGQSATGLMGFAYTGGVFTLFSLSGGTVHIGGINNNALVGWVTDALGNVVKGFVVHSDGSSEEIVPSIQSLSGTWTNVQVTGISESGIIVGYGSYDNHLTAFIGEPTVVPVPPALLLLSTGLAAVVGFRRFRRK